MIEIIAEDTNTFISCVRSNYSRIRDSRDTDGAEIKALLDLLYLAGIYHGNRVNLEELWRMDDFKLVMNLKKFLFLLRALRLDEINTRAERRGVDRLAPIRNIFEKFFSNCQKCYSLRENVTSDEKLEGFRGRCGFVQYIPKKTNKYGIKIYEMVDDRIFYTYDMEVYAGEQPDGPFYVINKPQDVVKWLIEPIHNTGRNTTTYNWFSSFELVRDLDENTLSFVGTLKKK
ncbi:piggyBac transposable element-derived protein 4-like [Stegodyphus dumicola]|uniref:piggyBac transposable element-derived protein 4-like n=1 Tax=Stegodyphus dumicola TaxID=202533 RepID=UPI0015B021F5|nr:piggyBac transposable element-derived protein 4-like [Stegodyphus dumicola]